jgi:hypothetical protein
VDSAFSNSDPAPSFLSLLPNKRKHRPAPRRFPLLQLRIAGIAITSAPEIALALAFIGRTQAGPLWVRAHLRHAARPGRGNHESSEHRPRTANVSAGPSGVTASRLLTTGPY